jgi:hypothetical protein
VYYDGWGIMAGPCTPCIHASLACLEGGYSDDGEGAIGLVR